ncbi:MAG: hypothetical protein ACOC1F_00640 [Myxococcota bacterium]
MPTSPMLVVPFKGHQKLVALILSGGGKKISDQSIEVFESLAALRILHVHGSTALTRPAHRADPHSLITPSCRSQRTIRIVIGVLHRNLLP